MPGGDKNGARAKATGRARPGAESDRAAGPPRAVTRRILHEARPYRRQLGGILALDLLATPIVLLTPIPLKIAVDSVIGGKPLAGLGSRLVPGWIGAHSGRLLVLAAVLQVVVVLLAQVQDTAAYVLRTVTGERLTLRFRSRMFLHAQRLSLAFHDQRGTSDSVYRIQYDAPSINYVTVFGVSAIFSAAVSLFAMVFVIARIDLPLALVALAVMPPLVVLSRSYNRRMRPRYKDVKQLESDAMHVVHEVLGAFRLVKAFGREESEGARFVSRSEQSVRGRIRLAFAEGGYGLFVNLTTAIGTAVVLYIGVRGVQTHRLTLGELLMIIAYLAQLYSPLKTISKEVGDLQSSLASAERAFSLMDETPDVDDRPDARPVDRVTGAIEFRGVSFRYGDDPDVLHDVSFAIQPGTKLGISGRTGAGKTTLISLLARFYDPREGTVAVDGVDIRNYRLRDLRAQFAVVLQDTVLLSTTIAENIAYARPDASFDQIVAAARSAGADEFIMGLPDGYDTVVGERGMRLSGGERQRISLARAFLKDAPILILDEPTSSVDVVTEAQIMSSMTLLMEGRTTIMIAHRLSTLEQCDARLELATGCVVGATGSIQTPGESVEGGPPPDETVARILGEIGERAGGGPPRLTERRTWVYQSTHGLEVLRCDWPDGTSGTYLCKYGHDVAGRIHAGYGHRRGVAHEAYIYGSLLSTAEAGAPHALGSYHDEATDTDWLVLEFLENVDRLNKSTEPDAFGLAAEWLGRFHRRAARLCADGVAPELPVYDAAYYRGWMERLAEFGGPLLERYPWLPEVTTWDAVAVTPLVEAPPTIVHGEFFPSNVLLEGRRVRTVDWESAAVAAGEVDLATLLFGWESPGFDVLVARYEAARWPDCETPPTFWDALTAARFYTCFRMLGDLPELTLAEESEEAFAALEALATDAGLWRPRASTGGNHG